MTTKTERIFATVAPAYWAREFSAIPIKSGAKAPAIRNWNGFNANLPSTERQAQWLKNYPNSNLGICTGTPINGDKILTAIDVDDPRLTSFVEGVVGESPCKKIGKKGITIFALAPKGTKSRKFAPTGSKPRVEIFGTTGCVVLPPSIHSETKEPYQWTGLALCEIDPKDLPILNEDLISLIRAVTESEHTETILSGEHSHDAALRLSALGLHRFSDQEHVVKCLKALFPSSYDGNTLDEIEEMVASAEDKGLGSQFIDYNPGDIGPIPLGYLSDGNLALRIPSMNRVGAYSSKALSNENDLIGLAPSHFWRSQFPRFNDRGDVTGINARAVADTLFEIGRSLGPFDLSRVRGRGIWREGQKTIINLSGQIPPGLEYEYVGSHPLDLTTDQKITGREVHEFLRLFNFKQSGDSILYLGWLKIAPVCGGLLVRPHLFLTGQKNSGKTSNIRAAENLIKPLVIVLDGQSSEAGIRQKLGPDSLPALVDEFESDGNRTKMRAVIKLARSAYSATGTVARGTPEGRVLEFTCRTIFLFAAINPIIGTAADMSRTIFIELASHNGDQKTRQRIEDGITRFDGLGPAWCQSAIHDLDLVLASQECINRKLPAIDSRHAMNMSLLLAGAWVALEGTIPTEEESASWVEEHMAVILAHDIQHEQDDTKDCLNHLLASMLDYREDKSIGSMIWSVMYHVDPGPWDADTETLKNRGIRIDEDMLTVANNHPRLNDIYRGTRWEDRGWASALLRIPGARKSDHPVRFGNGVKERAVMVPLSEIPFDKSARSVDDYNLEF